MKRVGMILVLVAVFGCESQPPAPSTPPAVAPAPAPPPAPVAAPSPTPSPSTPALDPTQRVVPEVEKIAADAALVAACVAQNAQGLTLDKIKERDKVWQEAKTPTPEMLAYTTNPAATALAAIEKQHPYFVEFILTDNQGANVAVTQITSDYWQGDEPKFTNAFREGKGGFFIARPQKDKSTDLVVSQVSVAVMKDGQAVGTLTVGVKLDKLP